MKKILFILSVLFSLSGYAQYYSTGQNPATVKWKQINTPNFRIVFPQQAERKARYIATLFTDLYAKIGKSVNNKPRKFTAILNSYSATSNGMVAWAPKRMELYATTPQNNEPQLWLNHLVTHEYRHVVQMNKVQQGLTKILNYIAGEQATALVVGLYLPYWFLEGDAVCSETALTPVGRGRLPEFKQLLRAQLLEKGNYHYDKAVNGSFKDFTPNRYKLGYYMVGMGRANYGNELWNNTLNKIGRNPFGITVFSTGIKEIMLPKRDSVFQQLELLQKKYQQQNIKVETVDWQDVKRENTRGEGGVMLYFDVMKQLAWQWKIEDDSIVKTDFVALTSPEKIYTNKRFPNKMSNGNIVYLSNGLNNGLEFWLNTPNGENRKIFTPGYMTTLSYDYCNNKLLWAESKPNVRWQKADKSVVVSYNIKSKKRKVYKFKTSMFAPSFNANESKFVAISTDNKGDNSLVIVDFKTGEILQQVKAENQEYYLTPKWMNNSEILVVKVNREGKQLTVVNLENGAEKTLFKSGYQNIKNPIVTEKYIYFTASFTGIDNLFAYSKKEGEIWQVTSSRFGACDVNVNGETIYYADYTANGYVLAKKKVNSADWKIWNGKLVTYKLADKLSQQIGEQLTPDTLLMDKFNVKNYSKLKHLFNIHSWAPIAISTQKGNDTSVDIGVSVASQNVASTMFATAGYRKKEGFENGQFFADISYEGWFPIIHTKIEYGKRKLIYNTIAKRINSNKKDTLQVRTNCKSLEWKSSVRIPLNLSSGQFTRKLMPKITYNYSTLEGDKTKALQTLNQQPTTIGNYNFADISVKRHILEYQLLFYNFNKKAPRDVQNRLGQVLVFDYRNTPFGTVNYGETWATQATVYLPGLAQHDGIKLYGGYQYQSNLNNYFADIVKNPRGVSGWYYNKKWSGSVNYAFPVCYPDWHIGPLVYFKRINLNLFYDFSYDKGTIFKENQALKFTNNFYSTGVEITTDSHLFHFAAPIKMGIRVGYENQYKKLFANLMFSISMN